MADAIHVKRIETNLLRHLVTLFHRRLDVATAQAVGINTLPGIMP